MDVTIPLAFTAGLLSFISPCVLPLIPAYIVLFTGLTCKELEHESANCSLKLFTGSILFILGFSVVFISFAIFINYFGRYIPRDILNIIGGSIVILFGLHVSGIFPIKFLNKVKKINFSYTPVYITGAFVMGMVFALGWTPCIGPILGSILMYASVQEFFKDAIFLLIAYCFGLGLPFLLISFFGIGFLTKILDRTKKYYSVVELISGILLIIIGILILLNKFWIA